MKWKRISKQKAKVFCYWADSSSRVSLSRRESETFFNFAGLRLTWQLWHFTRHTILLILLNTYHYYRYYYVTTTIHISPLGNWDVCAISFSCRLDTRRKKVSLVSMPAGFCFYFTFGILFLFLFKIVGKSSGRRYAHVYYPALARTLFVFVFCRRFWAEGNKKCNQSTHPGR